jgi:dTDP-4-amino-4,6-dideoxygalactose transaminase
MRDTFLVFAQPLIEQAEMDEVLDSMRKAWIGTGPKVHQFERDFAAYIGLPHAAALNSCTAALHLACLTMDLRPGDEVITTAMTFCATVNAIIHAGGTPVLADIDPATLNVDPAAIEAAITPRTRAILVVHFAGRACDMDAVTAIAARRGLRVIEDCAHAIETRYKGRQAGTFGDVGCFSFYATKNIVTGEGGMALSQDEALIRRIRIMGLHGMSADAWARFSDSGYKHYSVVDHGFKYNMTDMQAALGIHQLPRVLNYRQRRQEIWNRYMEELADLPVGLPAPVGRDEEHAYHLFTIRARPELTGMDRDAVLRALHERNIGSGVHYLSIAEHPYYQQRYHWRAEDTPHAMNYGRETLTLPLSPKLTDKDVDDVIEALGRIVGRRRGSGR